MTFVQNKEVILVLQLYLLAQIVCYSTDFRASSILTFLRCWFTKIPRPVRMIMTTSVGMAQMSQLRPGLNIIFSGAVSYTHLDVYKRQNQQMPSRHLNKLKLQRTTNTKLALNQTWLVQTLPRKRPVSYTHLDVYKRQHLF